jgi:hypothetical protein
MMSASSTHEREAEDEEVQSHERRTSSFRAVREIAAAAPAAALDLAFKRDAVEHEAQSTGAPVRIAAAFPWHVGCSRDRRTWRATKH